MTPDDALRIVRLAIAGAGPADDDAHVTHLTAHQLRIVWQHDRDIPVIVTTADGAAMEDFFVAVSEAVVITPDGGALGLTGTEVAALEEYRDAATEWLRHMRADH